ncbi:hypothetical protein DPMN_181689 [Dreissena polymorpha]|uniref:Uncharacterized protein n=1 Tax=Dreissena polymorpha TaxID=45954 RepID=A0A9D4I1W4_DREPO|nr:hypothetical protein DPMN_181689 [Dreissena polymorpha]
MPKEASKAHWFKKHFCLFKTQQPNKLGRYGENSLFFATRILWTTTSGMMSACKGTGKDCCCMNWLCGIRALRIVFTVSVRMSERNLVNTA